MRIRIVQMTWLGLGVWGVCFFAGCAQPEPKIEPNEVPAPAKHAVHSAELKEIMGDLQLETARRWPQEIEDLRAAQAQQDRQRQLRDARQLAERLAIGARTIPAAIQDVQMSQRQRKAFLANVDMLEEQAMQLQQAAASGSLDRMEQSLNRIQTTCYGCHSQFRQYTGPLRFGS